MNKHIIDSYVTKSQELKETSDLDGASLLVFKALQLDPDNPRLSSLKSQIRHKRDKHFRGPRSLSPANVKPIAYNFIKRFYPTELDLFDLAWRVFKDIKPQDYHKGAVSNALGIVGRDETFDIATPKVIVILGTLSEENIYALNEREIGQKIARAGSSLVCSEELINQISKYILQQRKRS